MSRGGGSWAAAGLYALAPTVTRSASTSSQVLELRAGRRGYSSDDLTEGAVNRQQQVHVIAHLGVVKLVEDWRGLSRRGSKLLRCGSLHDQREQLSDFTLARVACAQTPPAVNDHTRRAAVRPHAHTRVWRRRPVPRVEAGRRGWQPARRYAQMHLVVDVLAIGRRRDEEVYSSAEQRRRAQSVSAAAPSLGRAVLDLAKALAARRSAAI